MWLRLGVRPAGGTWTTCFTALRRTPVRTNGVWKYTKLWFTTAAGRNVDEEAGPVADPARDRVVVG